VVSTIASGILIAFAGRVLWGSVKRAREKIDSTRPDFAIGFADHDGALALDVSNRNGGEGKQAQCVIIDDGRYAYGFPRSDLVASGKSFSVLTPFGHGSGPYGVIAACNVSQRVQFLWRVERDRQRRRLKRRSLDLFKSNLKGPHDLMKHVHGTDQLGPSAGSCRFVEDRTATPLIDL
jgi:hypothetical protein